MSSRKDNQEVGLEAATLERVRNSSLVKWFGADNVAGLSVIPKLRHSSFEGWVGERRVAGEAAAEARRGRHTREDAGMSRERGARSPCAENARVTGEGERAQG